ncbi:MAG: RNA methyltransferase [Bacteroidales bacterium]
MPYFEIGIYQSKSVDNLGTLWRSAYQMGAAGVFTIGRRYKNQPSDPFKVPKHIPLRSFKEFDHFLLQRPSGAILVGVEQGGTPLSEFEHPPQAIYLLGSEDLGLPEYVLEKCNLLVSLEAMIKSSYNVAVAGSIVMYDRVFGKQRIFTGIKDQPENSHG